MSADLAFRFSSSASGRLRDNRFGHIIGELRMLIAMSAPNDFAPRPPGRHCSFVAGHLVVFSVLSGTRRTARSGVHRAGLRVDAA